MAWYRAGTVSVTASSTTVTGTGTAFVANARVGDAFIGPDGRLYEVSNIASDTAISILPAYIGASASAQSYAIAPVQGYTKKLADEAAELINDFSQLGDLGTAAGLDAVTSSTDTTADRLLKVGAGHQQLDPNLYRRGNIVGTVSQSGGVPTGAIIQRGSNANGEFTRLADGTMSCWRRELSLSSPDIASGSIFISGNNTFSTAAAFVGTPTKFANLIGPRTQAAWIICPASSGPSADNWVFRLASSVSLSAQQILVDMSAKGRWF